MNKSKENKEMKERYDNDYEKNCEAMVNQIKNNIDEQSKLKTINQQQNQLLINQQAVLNHLYDVQYRARLRKIFFVNDSTTYYIYFLTTGSFLTIHYWLSFNQILNCSTSFFH